MTGVCAEELCHLLWIIKYAENILCCFNLLYLITRRRHSWHSLDKSHKSYYKIDNYVSEEDRKAETENNEIKNRQFAVKINSIGYNFITWNCVGLKIS